MAGLDFYMKGLDKNLFPNSLILLAYFSFFFFFWGGEGMYLTVLDKHWSIEVYVLWTNAAFNYSYYTIRINENKFCKFFWRLLKRLSFSFE